MMREGNQEIQGRPSAAQNPAATPEQQRGLPELSRYRIKRGELFDPNGEGLDAWQTDLPSRIEQFVELEELRTAKRIAANAGLPIDSKTANPKMDARSGRAPVSANSVDQDLFDIPAGMERLPYEHIRETYFRLLVRYQSPPNPREADAVAQFFTQLQAIRDQEQGRNQGQGSVTLSPAQTQRRADLEANFREYIASCAPMSPDAAVQSIFLSEPRTIRCANGEVMEAMLAELRNSSGQSLLCFDGKIKAYEFSKPVSMLIASTGPTSGPFQYEVLYSRAAYEADLQELRATSVTPFVDMEYPYLMRRIRSEIARISAATLQYELQEKGYDAGGVAEALGRAADAIDILDIEFVGKRESIWDSFSVTTTQGRYIVYFMWAEHDYAVHSMVLEVKR